MAITGIGTLTEFGLNQAPAQPLKQAPQTGEQGHNAGVATTPNDQFIPSAQNGQQQNTAEAAGLFTVAQLTPFTPAASALLAAAPDVLINQETAALNVNAAATQLAGAAGSLANQANSIVGGHAAPPIPNANLAALAATQTGAPANAVANAQAPAATAATANVAATATARVTEQLQGLNNALEALGLSPADLQQIDQIASVIKDFNPAAFTSLAYQLAALAPSSATQLAPANQPPPRTPHTQPRLLQAHRANERCEQLLQSGEGAFKRRDEETHLEYVALATVASGPGLVF
jgi:hypothetical protein